MNGPAGYRAGIASRPPLLATALAVLAATGCFAPVGARVATPFPGQIPVTAPTVPLPAALTPEGTVPGRVGATPPSTPPSPITTAPSRVAPGDPDGAGDPQRGDPGAGRGCPAPAPSPTRPVPAELARVLAERLADPLLSPAGGAAVGASVWIEGYGEVVAHDADRALLPASNQKLLTALGALAVLPADAAFTTRLLATGPVVDGVVGGDLILVGGGDPTVAVQGPHSLGTLAEQLLAAGVRSVAGDVVGDESRHVPSRRAPGWEDWHVPTYAGPLSALMVEHNWHRDDPTFVADPALGNAELFRTVLEGAGIGVAGTTRTGTAPAGTVELGRLRSADVAALVGTMLLESDNELAELLTREAGVAGSGIGSTEAGTAALTAGLAPLCLSLGAGWADGSGLSRTDRRSARELRALLQAGPSAPGWSVVAGGLPVGGRTGTLAGRFIGTPAEGNVRAKTGYINDGRSLAGLLTTAGGRAVVFAILVNGPGAAASVDAIDALVVALASDTS